MPKKKLRIGKFLWLQARLVYNPAVRRLFKAGNHPLESSDFREIRDRVRLNTDISDHLTTLFSEALSIRPKVIVELGVRGGESTFVLERVARLFESTLISVDIDDCISASQYPHWTFVKEDDIAFAGRFEAFCRERGCEPRIDLLFIDTSHNYDHSRQEIAAWFPFLSDHAKVILHDTHMKAIYFKKDHSVAFGWDNQRGVIRAIEEYFGAHFDESRDFIDWRQGWLIRHTAASNGFTVLERIPLPS